METQAELLEKQEADSKQEGVGRRLHGVALVSVLTALMIALLLEAFDNTLIGNAMPQIIGTLNGLNLYGWVEIASMLGAVAMIPVIGKLSDMFGRKWFLVIGVGIFIIASLLSSLAQNMPQLLACRALQGMGNGIGIALVITVVGDILPPADRPKWQPMYWLIFGFANAVGPILSGWLTKNGPLLGNFITDTTRWRWVFFINVPLGLIALITVLIFLPAQLHKSTTSYSLKEAFAKIDIWGSLLAVAATICLLLGLTWGGNQTYSWVSPQIIVLLIAAVVLYTLFFLVESKAAEPIIPLDLFRNQVFAADAILTLLLRMAMLGFFVYLPLFYQGVLAIPAENSGRMFLPFALSMVGGAIMSGTSVAITKKYQLATIIGTIILTIGSAIFVTQMSPSANTTLIIVASIMSGAGVGGLFPILTLAAQNVVPHSRLGVGTATVNYISQIGPAFGLAIIGGAINLALSSTLLHKLPSTPAERIAFGNALHYGFIVVLVFSLSSIITAFFLKDVPMSKHFKED